MGPDTSICRIHVFVERLERQWICRWNNERPLRGIWDRLHIRRISSWYKSGDDLARNRFDYSRICSPVRHNPYAVSLVNSSRLCIHPLFVWRRILFGSRCSRPVWTTCQIANFHCIHWINGQLCLHLHKQRTYTIRRILPYFRIIHGLFSDVLGGSFLVFRVDWVPNIPPRCGNLWIASLQTGFTSRHLVKSTEEGIVRSQEPCVEDTGLNIFLTSKPTANAP